MTPTNGQYSSLDEFWPFYVSQHLNPVNRKLHFLGTTGGLLFAAGAACLRQPILALAALGTAYGAAWIGHFAFERNRPATFTYPLLSFRADFRMYWLTLTNQMDAEILLRTRELKDLRKG